MRSSVTYTQWLLLTVGWSNNYNELVIILLISALTDTNSDMDKWTI